MPTNDLINIATTLSDQLRDLDLSPPISYVYDPTDHAREPLSRYFQKYGNTPRKVVLVGMNPGPWGMLQTGVPFGEVSFVREWMGIDGKVGQPETVHPKRPIHGFSCTRSEVSGKRLWGWARDRFQTADLFFRQFMVVNYCPLAFFDEGGKNVTPDKLKKADKERLFRLCDGATKRTIELLKPEFVIGIGKFAYDRCTAALDGMDVKVGRVTHPSPANPAANRGWEAIIEKELQEMGIQLPSRD
ncbi:MAG: single-stranded DNA-binding protein [bacterium]|nr:single-stranded DNA-binding protein [bacterium]